MIVLLGISLIGLISEIFQVTGAKFYLELLIVIGILSLLLLAAVLMYHGIKFGYIISAIASIIMVLNLLAFYLLTELRTLLFISIISSLAAFLLSIISMAGPAKEKRHVKVKKASPAPVVSKKGQGKVVAGKTSKYYYDPSNPIARRIKKSTRVYYASEEEARKAGLKPYPQ